MSITVNPMAACAQLSIALQKNIDIISFASAGFPSVTESNFRNPVIPYSFHPANNQRLSLEEVRAETENWLLRGVITDAIDHTGAFLVETFCNALLISLVKNDQVNIPIFEALRTNRLPRFHGLVLPAKIDNLRSEFGVVSIYEPHILSLNKLRNCMVHRQGIVGNRDVNGPKGLHVTFRDQTIYMKDDATGFERPIVFGEPVKPKECADTTPSTIYHKWQDKELVFELGKRAKISFQDLTRCVTTFWAFAREMCLSLETFSDGRGIQPNPDVP